MRRAVDIRRAVRFDGDVKGLRFLIWLVWFLVALAAFCVLLQYGPARFQQGAAEFLSDVKGWVGLSR